MLRVRCHVSEQLVKHGVLRDGGNREVTAKLEVELVEGYVPDHPAALAVASEEDVFGRNPKVIDLVLNDSGNLSAGRLHFLKIVGALFKLSIEAVLDESFFRAIIRRVPVPAEHRSCWEDKLHVGEIIAEEAITY